jgi:hypothetical protein
VSRRWAWAVWLTGCSLVITGSVATTAVDMRSPADLPFGVGFAVLRPLLLSLGLATGVLLTTGSYAEAGLQTSVGPLPGDVWAAWLSSWLSIPTFFGATVMLLLLFPDGRLVSPGWRWAAVFAAAGVGSATVAAAFTPRRISPGFDNPVGATGRSADLVRALEDGTDALALPVMLVAAAALVVRLRRSRGVERQQLKMFTYVATLVGLGLGTTILTRGLLADAAFLLGLCALATLPVVTGVSILRHGLYGVDVVIKRTLVYGPLTAMLVGAYLGTVLLLQAALRPMAGESQLAVAGSTLTVAALFRPLRARVQAVVDRRFYRARYDAARTVASFSRRLREQVDLDSVSADLRRVVRDTVQRVRVSVWLRDSP